jgi:hypothetical protein
MSRAAAAVPLSKAKLRHLADALGGQSEVARILRVDRSRVTRWLAHETPDPQNQAKLDALEFVLNRLLQHFYPDTARKWLMGINAHLGNRRPIDLIAQNRVAEVIAAIEQDELGAFA